MGLPVFAATFVAGHGATIRSALTGTSAALCLSLLVTPALARSGGIASVGCDGCHQGSKIPTVTLTSDPANPMVGQDITLTIKVSNVNGSTAGFYLTTAYQAPGMFQALEAGTAATATDVMHTTPRAGTGGYTTFKAKWIASQPSGVEFDAYAVSANADRTNRGDGAGVGKLELLIGCTGATYYIDQDGDGYGSTDPVYAPRKDCSPPPGYAAMTGDCDDFHASVHPGALEQCDLKDNDCDGNADEDVVDQPYCEDADGDGHGVKGGMTKLDCKPSPGFGVCDGDCDDHDKDVYPGASEQCDGRDNNCDGKVDEGVRPVCGVGLCARYAAGCSSRCTPGPPFEELCNGWDDDCDGVVDNGSNQVLCGDANIACVQGRCQGEGSNPGASGAGAGGSANPNQSGAPGLTPNGAPASCALTAPTAPQAPGSNSLAWVAALALGRRAARRRNRAATKPA